MEAAELVIAAIGTIAGIAGAYFAWLAVKNKRRNPARATSPVKIPAKQEPAAYDVFISYTHADADLVKDLAERLRRRGVAVALDELLLPGSPLVHGVEKLILESANGLLVYSPASLASSWVSNEYAVLMQRSIESRQLFIPVLTDGTEKSDLPLFAQARMYSDLRGVSDAEFDRQVERIVAALRTAAR